MRNIVLVCLVCAVVTVAGCVDVQSASQDEGSGLDDEKWERLEFSASGLSDEWVLFYQPLPEPTNRLRMGVVLTVDAEGDGVSPTALFASASPFVVVDWGDGPMIYIPWEENLIVDREGGDMDRSRDGRTGIAVGGGEILGLMYIIGANVPWNLELEIVLDGATGGTRIPDFVSEGTALFSLDHDRSIGLTQDGALAEDVRLDETMESPGWTHIEYDYDSIQPVGIRNLEIVFPDGRSVSSVGTLHGYYSPLLGGGSASTSGWYDACGATSSVSGEFRSRLSYVQTASRLEAALVHFGFGPDSLPAGVDLWPYCGISGDMFPDGIRVQAGAVGSDWMPIHPPTSGTF